MNTGIISSRYAKALFEYTEGTGNSEAVAAQVPVLVRALSGVPELQRALEDPVAVPIETKISLFSAVLGGEELCPELDRFLRQVIHNGREPELRLIFQDYLTKYYRSRGIRMCRLITAVESEGLRDSLVNLMSRVTGDDIIVETEVRPGLIGGFIFEIDDYMVDASVARQIETIRHQFIEKNRRVV